MRAALAPLVLVGVLSSPALAEERAVLVLRLDGGLADPSLAENLDASFRKEVQNVVGDRLLSQAPTRPVDCETEQECMAQVALVEGAAKVVATRLFGGPEQFTLEASLYEDMGALVIGSSRSFEGLPSPRLLRGLAVQLLEPARYTGRLRFEGVPEGAQVMVDRLPISKSDVARSVALTVGQHHVELVQPEGSGERHMVTLGYDEEVTLRFGGQDASAAAPAPAVGFPAWPSIATGAVAGVSALLAVVFVLDGVVTQAFVNGQAASIVTLPKSNGNPHFYAKYVAQQARRLTTRRVAAQSSFGISTTAAVIAVLSGGAAGALAYVFLESPAPEASAVE